MDCTAKLSCTLSLGQTSRNGATWTSSQSTILELHGLAAHIVLLLLLCTRIRHQILDRSRLLLVLFECISVEIKTRKRKLVSNVLRCDGLGGWKSVIKIPNALFGIQTYSPSSIPDATIFATSVKISSTPVESFAEASK